MTLNDAYLVSQIAAAIFVAPTLLYLALQVRQNTAQMRATASRQYLEASKDLNLGIIQNKEVASVYRRGCDDLQSLNADEKTQFFFYIGQFYQTFSTMFDLWEAGELPESAWHTIRKHIISMMSMAGTRHVFDVWAREGLAPEFIAYVDTLCAASEATYSLKDALAGPAPRTVVEKAENS